MAGVGESWLETRCDGIMTHCIPSRFRKPCEFTWQDCELVYIFRATGRFQERVASIQAFLSGSGRIRRIRQEIAVNFCHLDVRVVRPAKIFLSQYLVLCAIGYDLTLAK